MKILTVYYSYSGNTRKIAEKIQREIGGDIAEIVTEKPYSGSYNDVVEQGQREVNDGYKPTILPLSRDAAEYDVIILGTPVWWYTYAPAVKTFLETVDWTEKRFYPFATNGRWIGHTSKDFEKACRGAHVARTMNIRFDGERQTTPNPSIEEWIRSIQ